MIDVTQQINSVDRQVGRRTLEAGEARTLTISRVYDTPAEDLWDACTSPDAAAALVPPRSPATSRLGGRFAIEGNASGTIERCEPPHSFDATWEFGGAVSWIELRLTPEATADAVRARTTSPTSRTRSGRSTARARSASAGTER